MTIRQWSALLRQRELSCVELIQQTLSDLKQRDHFHSLITLTEDHALKEAAERDKELAAGLDRGPFHGIPVAYKDLFYTRGIRTTAGSLLFKDFVPDYDATVVARLNQAGAICVGKTNLHELAYGCISTNPHFGFVLNPRDTTRSPGGSSGGSATLVAAGLLPMCLGTDTGGSIRIPASFCGIAGLKPTYGRVSRYGILPLAFSLDHAGPLGASVDDCALAMNAIAGPDPLDTSCIASPAPAFDLPRLANLSGVRIGVPENFFFENIDPEVLVGVNRAIAQVESLGASVSKIQVPDLYAANTAARIIQFAEASSLYIDQTDHRLFGKDVWALLQQGKLIAGHEYVNAQRLRTLFRRDFDALWQKVDFLLTPATPIVAPRLEDTTVRIGNQTENTRLAATRLVRAINFVGEPAISIPCGETRERLPIGLQIIGAPFTEPRLLQFARTVEEAVL